ncbi:MAG: VWA domain-containing protein [Pseudomonadota bacterium]
MLQQETEGDRPTEHQGIAVWRIAKLVAALLAVDPHALGGLSLRAQPGPARDAWRRYFLHLLPDDPAIVNAPSGIDPSALTGGLDIAATLASGRPCIQKGLLPLANEGVLIVKMAERLSVGAATAIAGAQDMGVAVVERDSFSQRWPACICVVLEDEGIADDERPPDMLLERVAFTIDLSPVSLRDLKSSDPDREFIDVERITAARRSLEDIKTSDEMETALSEVGLKTGDASLRSFQFVLRTARVLAALTNREEVDWSIAQTATMLVYGIKIGDDAAVTPQETEPDERSQPQSVDNAPDNHPSASPENGGDRDSAENHDSEQYADQQLGQRREEFLESIIAAINSGAVTLSIPNAERCRQRSSLASDGKAGATTRSTRNGRPRGTRGGDPRTGGRLDILATMRSAAPWRKLREAPRAPMLLRVYPSDIRLKRFDQKTGASVIFVVDASGSAALHRLGEAKGAVERLLQACYTRRDMVSVIVFRGYSADVVLRPTRSLLRARRALAAAPGGGGTPLAMALGEAFKLSKDEIAKGRDPLIVMLSDGRGNIDLSGSPGRAQAEADEQSMAQLIAKENINVIFFDTGRRPSARAETLSHQLRARYSPLPYADSRQIADVVANEVQSRRHVTKH